MGTPPQSQDIEHDESATESAREHQERLRALFRKWSAQSARSQARPAQARAEPRAERGVIVNLTNH